MVWMGLERMSQNRKWVTDAPRNGVAPVATGILDEIARAPFDS